MRSNFIVILTTIAILMGCNKSMEGNKVLNENFKVIDKWLGKNAEKILKFSLQNPATKDQIRKLDNEIGKLLPEDFKGLYLWHNGMSDEKNVGSLFFGMDIFTIDKIIEEYNDRKKISQNDIVPLEKFDKEIDGSNIFNVNWLKFGSDGSRTGLYLDFSPAKEGKYGQIIFIDDEYSVGILVADSISDLIEQFIKDINNGLYSLNHDALEDSVHFLESDSSIDIINWNTSERWKR
jgi:cell wall assembly regulator SMI1